MNLRAVSEAYDIGMFSPALLASLVAAGVAVIGLLTVWRYEGWAAKHSGKFTAFAAGVLITTAISLVPEAVEVCAQAGWFMLGGYMLLYLITFSFRNDAPLGLIWAPVIGIGFHSFIDGLQYGVLYEIDTQTGMAASAGLIAHEFAEGVILFSILQRAGLSNRVAFLGGFVGAALTTPLGALVAESQIHHLGPTALGGLTAVAAGALLYVGATHLPLHMRRDDPNTKPIIPMIIGVALALTIQSLTNHDASDGVEQQPSADVIIVAPTNN